MGVVRGERPPKPRDTVTGSPESATGAAGQALRGGPSQARDRSCSGTGPGLPRQRGSGARPLPPPGTARHGLGRARPSPAGRQRRAGAAPRAPAAPTRWTHATAGPARCPPTAPGAAAGPLTW